MHVHGATETWLIQYFLTGSAKASFIHRLGTERRKMRRNSCCVTIIYPPSKYASDDIIATADSKLKHLRQMPIQSPVDYSEYLWSRAHRCRHVFTESYLIAFFIEGLHEEVKLQVRQYCADNKRVAMESLSRYANSISPKRSAISSAAHSLKCKSRAVALPIMLLPPDEG